MDAGSLKILKEVVVKLVENPLLALEPELDFFREFLLSWGGTVPEPQKDQEEKDEDAAEEEEEEEDPDRVPEDMEPYPEKAPDGEIELTDAQMDKLGELKQQAADSLENGDIQKALDKYTEAITMGNATAMLYARRAETLLKLNRPNACIVDCTSAVAINPDIGKAYKLRGRAYRNLGRWEEAHGDLSRGQQLDYDDDTMEVQKFVAEKFKKIIERRTKTRLQEEAEKEAELTAKREARLKRVEAAKQAAAEKAKLSQSEAEKAMAEMNAVLEF
jgi:suppressor of tumorigenicity protein 13